ncbi:MAG: carbohydrate-binding family 9-like protein [Bacteroidales bacterium]
MTVDGSLSEPSWESARWSSDFTDIEGTLRPEPLYRTRVKMLWDDNYLYIGAEISEPHIWAYLKQRDTVIFYDNDFEVFIDPGGDTHGYYEVEMNAAGTVWDLLLTVAIPG